MRLRVPNVVHREVFRWVDAPSGGDVFTCLLPRDMKKHLDDKYSDCRTPVEPLDAMHVHGLFASYVMYAVLRSGSHVFTRDIVWLSKAHWKTTRCWKSRYSARSSPNSTGRTRTDLVERGDTDYDVETEVG